MANLFSGIKAPQPSIVIDKGKIVGITDPKKDQTTVVTPRPSTSVSPRPQSSSGVRQAPTAQDFKDMGYVVVTDKVTLQSSPTQAQLLGTSQRPSILPTKAQDIAKRDIERFETSFALQKGSVANVQEMERQRRLAQKLKSLSEARPKTFGTIIASPPTIGSIEEERERRIRGEAVVAVPAQYFGTIFDKPISPELAQRAAMGGPVRRAVTFLDPRFQYDVALDTERIKEDVKDVIDLNKRLERVTEEVRIAEQRHTKGEIDDEQLNRVFEKYNAFANRYNAAESVQNLQGVKADAMQSIAKSNLPTQEKVKLAGAIRLVQNVPLFVSPVARAVVGTEMVRTGLQSWEVAETPSDRLLSGIQIGGGALLGLGGLIPVRGVQLRGTPGQARFLKGVTYASGTSIGGSIGALDYFGTLGRTGDPGTALGAGLGTGLSIVGPLAARDVSRGVSRAGKEVGKAFSPKQIKKLFADKRGQTTVTDVVPESEFIYDYTTGRYIKKAQLTRVQATTEFKFATKERQLKILREAFSNKVYIGDEAKMADLQLAKQFLDESGVPKVRQTELLKEITKQLFPQREQVIIRADSEGTVLQTPKVKDAVLVSEKPLTVTSTSDVKFTQPPESVFAGTGMYEKTDSVLSFRTRPRSVMLSDSMDLQGLKEVSLLEPRLGLMSDTMQDSLSDSMQRSDTALSFSPRITTATRTDQALTPRVDTLTRQDLRSDQRLDQKSDQRLDTRLKSRLATLTNQTQVSRLDLLKTPRQIRPREPRKPDPLKPRGIVGGGLPSFSGPRKKTRDRKPFGEDDKFFAFTKRYGKKKLVAVGRTPQEAISRGKVSVLGTLGATLKVKTSKGKAVPISSDPFFRPSKTDPLAVVQRQVTPFGGRLTTKGERREIQLIRRRTKKSNEGGI